MQSRLSFGYHARPMALNLSGVRHAKVGRLARYASVSVISTATTLSVLGLLVGVIGFPATWANVIAVAIGTVPSFALNRRWVWSYTGPLSPWRQAVPYCVLSFAGLVISTVSVHVVSDATAGSARLVHTVAVEVANLGSYGALWLLQFVLCDRVLFRRAGTAPRDAEAQEAMSAA